MTLNQEDFLQTIKKLEPMNEEQHMTFAEYSKRAIFQRGLEKWRHERDLEITKAMLLKGINVEKIAAVTEHSKEEYNPWYNNRNC